MITCKLLLCAEGVLRDAERGGISIFNILEGLEVTGFPFFLQKMDIFALFERLPDDPPIYNLLFRISIGEVELVATRLAVDFRDKLRNRSMVHIQGLVIPHPGLMRVAAKLDGNDLNTYDIRIEQMGVPRVESHQAAIGPGGTP
jgi:hypothetical protein